MLCRLAASAPKDPVRMSGRNDEQPGRPPSARPESLNYLAMDCIITCSIMLSRSENFQDISAHHSLRVLIRQGGDANDDDDDDDDIPLCYAIYLSCDRDTINAVLTPPR